MDGTLSLSIGPGGWGTISESSRSFEGEISITNMSGGAPDEQITGVHHYYKFRMQIKKTINKYIMGERVWLFCQILLLLSKLAYSQNKQQLPFDSFKEEKLEAIDYGLVNLDLQYTYRLNETGFYLDTIKISARPSIGYKLEAITLDKKKINNSIFEYRLSAQLVKYHLQQRIISSTIEINGEVLFEGLEASNISITHQIINTPEITKRYLIVQYIWEIHYWLLLIAVIVLLIKRSPLNLTHGLILVIPILGSLAYLTKQAVQGIKSLRILRRS